MMWVALLGLIKFPVYGMFSDVAGWDIDERLKYVPEDWAGV
jgi:hypothetical protein